MRQTFNKEERLKSRKLIQQLFAEGKSLNAFPIRLLYLPSDHDSPYRIQAGVTVSKRNFKKAVQRNRIKRLLREAYRKNKRILYDELADKHRSIIFSLIYIGNEEETYPLIEKKIIAALHRLISEIAKNPQQNTPVS